MPSGIYKRKSFTQEHKDNISKSLTGNKHPMFGKFGKNNPNYGSTRKQESKNRMRNAQLDSIKSQETKDKIGKANCKGDNVKYSGRHGRIVKLKGPAKNYKCVGDGINSCHRQAHHWSNIDHKYSLIPTDYLPRCSNCHKKYDIKYNTHDK